MEKIDYGFYDSIDSTAARWLSYLLQTKGKIGFTQLGSIDEEDLWLLSIARHVHIYSDTIIYVDCNWLDFLWLRYIKKFKFIKHYNSKKDKGVFLINAIEFEKEIAEACNTDIATIVKIYDAYYRR